MSPKPSLLRDRLKEATAKEILAAAEAELAEKGLAATSMSSIAERAGVAVGTLYNYFKDKEVLLSTLLEERRQEFAVILNEAVAAGGARSFEAKLEAVTNAIFQVFESHRNFLRIMLENEKPVGKNAGEPRKTPAMHFIDRLRPLVEEGVKSGALAPVDTNLYAAALASLLRGIMIERLADNSRPFRDATPFVVRMFLDGARRRE